MTTLQILTIVCETNLWAMGEVCMWYYLPGEGGGATEARSWVYITYLNILYFAL